MHIKVHVITKIKLKQSLMLFVQNWWSIKGPTSIKQQNSNHNPRNGQSVLHCMNNNILVIAFNRMYHLFFIFRLWQKYDIFIKTKNENFQKRPQEVFYNLGQKICTLFHFLARFVFTTSETELDYYHQKVPTQEKKKT